MKRVIARLDIKGNRLVKGIHLEGWRFLADHPNDYCFKYYQHGIDEIIYVDAVASLYNRDSLKEIIKKTTDNVFVPLTVGGGIRSVEDAFEILRSGADKVAICSQAVKTPHIISEVASKFGNQCMVLSIQAKKNQNGSYSVWYDVAREKTEIDVIEWAQKGEELGAGEILLTSIDFEGLEKGMDVELINLVSNAVSIPVIASGGFGKPQDFVHAINSGADAVAVAKSLHYEHSSIEDIKKAAKEAGIQVR
ncbi:MAG: imidazole glycerol phosphate synthase subunit HisF [Bacteroidia bacterium]|nr:imidazole glycerol phosphate synthase subunit HisF [Bacteroidia bacterium]